MSLKEILKKILQRLDASGTVYTAAWTASSSSAGNTRCTAYMTIPAGTYIIMLRVPDNNQPSNPLPYCLQGVDNCYFKSVGTDATCMVITTETQLTTCILTAFSAVLTFSNTARGGLTAIRIA